MDIQLLYWHWLVIGMILVVGEIFIPSFTILWFGLAHWWSVGWRC